MSVSRLQADAVAANKAIWDGINTLISLQREWNAGDYGNSGTPDIAATGSVVFDTANAFVAVLNEGHATNMAHLLS